jgi:hypothetical protein
MCRKGEPGCKTHGVVMLESCGQRSIQSTENHATYVAVGGRERQPALDGRRVYEVLVGSCIVRKHVLACALSAIFIAAGYRATHRSLGRR